jgi:hypothetical protein
MDDVHGDILEPMNMLQHIIVVAVRLAAAHQETHHSPCSGSKILATVRAYLGFGRL